MSEQPKMTQYEAQQYYLLLYEIDLYHERLEQNAREAARWAENAEMVAALSEYRQTLKTSLAACERQCERFENWLADVPDPQIQHWIYLRCVEGMSWVDMGAELGLKAETIRRAVARYFEREAAR